MDYTQLIADYKESGATTSPVWIWFDKHEKDARCTLCGTTVLRKDSSTSCMVNHLRHKHGWLSKYNAWKENEELSALKETRQKNKRKMSESA